MTLEGNPWFHAGDVCDILGLSNASGSAHNLSTLDKTEVRHIAKIHVSPGSDWPNRGASAVSESGLYSLIFRSKKPEAKDFQNYVTKEVLPSIRKTGSYVTGQPSLVENPQMDPLHQEFSTGRPQGGGGRSLRATQRISTTTKAAMLLMSSIATD